jgi:CheY-like chemotaxis protein
MLRVLLVDDEPAILRLLQTILALAEFEVATSTSAAGAVERLQKERFDLVLTDMRMETPTAGYEVVKAASKLQPRPKIVILTAFPVPAAQWKQSGADALVVKGTDICKLPEQLRGLMKTPTKSSDRR